MIFRVEGEYRGSSKTPQFLRPSRTGAFAKDGLYIWNSKVQEVKWQGFYLTLLIVGVLGVCCFPVWPISMKLGAWYLSVTLLCLIIGTTLVRYLVFLSFFTFGYDFWIFPNMYDDRAGFWEVFYPVYFFKARDDSLFSVAMRVVVAAFLVSSSVYLYLNPQIIEDLKEFSVGSVSELVSWGEDKLLSVSVI